MNEKPDYTRLSCEERALVRSLCTPDRSNMDIAQIVGCAPSSVRYIRIRDRLPQYTGPSFRGASWWRKRAESTPPRTLDPAVLLYRTEKARAMPRLEAQKRERMAAAKRELAMLEAAQGRPRKAPKNYSRTPRVGREDAA